MIFDKVLQIYEKFYICVHCLGRMFSLLGSYTTNQERGTSLLLSMTMDSHKMYLSNNDEQQRQGLDNLKLLAEKAKYLPSQKVLRNEGIGYLTDNKIQSCYLCQDIFSNIKQYVTRTKKEIEGIEFDTFLVGTTPDSYIINREDKFKSELNILEAESFKSHFNRIVGKRLMEELKKSPDFNNPDLLIVYSISKDFFSVELNPRSLFIFGKYNKLIRGIPQTHWFCNNCNGKGCKLCNFSGKQYLTSVEELISPEFIKESRASNSKFHGAGREDIDVRMLGQGRPFIIELRNPKRRILDLLKIEKKVNRNNKRQIKIHDLRYSNKKEVIMLKTKAKDTRKQYRAIVKAKSKITKEEFGEKLHNLKNVFENQEIHQRTPQRVSHRRSDKIREKFIFRIDGKFLKSTLFQFTIETQGGTYIKELIHGDEGRTSPSFSEVFKMPLVCKELDVLEISH